MFQYYTIGRKQTWSTVEDLVHFSNKTPIPWKALTHFNYSIHQYSRDQKLQMMLSQFPGSKFKSRLEMGAAEETRPVPRGDGVLASLLDREDEDKWRQRG